MISRMILTLWLWCNEKLQLISGVYVLKRTSALAHYPNHYLQVKCPSFLQILRHHENSSDHHIITVIDFLLHDANFHMHNLILIPFSSRLSFTHAELQYFITFTNKALNSYKPMTDYQGNPVHCNSDTGEA